MQFTRMKVKDGEGVEVTTAATIIQSTYEFSFCVCGGEVYLGKTGIDGCSVYMTVLFIVLSMLWLYFVAFL